MNQDSTFPPMLPPSTELGALLFAVLPCLQETYRPLASFAYHMTELTKMKSIPSVPSFSGLSDIDALITDKDIMLRSLSFYGRMFHMPLLSAIANLLQGMQFYRTYKDILPGLFSGMSAGSESSSPFGNMTGLSPDLFSMLGGLSPDLLSSLFSGFSGSFAPRDNAPSSSVEPSHVSPVDATVPDDIPTEAGSAESSVPNAQNGASEPDDTLYNTLFSFLTPEQQKIYEQLMHTD